MAGLKFHDYSDAKRRGDGLPARLRIAARRGVTLVELMISMLILSIVCISWLEIIGIQSARKESRRREAVDRLAGMMDAFMYHYRQGGVAVTGYHVVVNKGIKDYEIVPDGGTNTVHAVFEDDISPIGYQLCVVRKADLPNQDRFLDAWTHAPNRTCLWLVGRLYERSGTVAEAGKMFFSLPVCIGFYER